MNAHPYLRAYMAGITLPTMMLLVVLSGFLLARYTFQIPIPIERAIVFPMALVPNIFGVWNIFYLWLRPRRHLPIGFHGAILPFILAPAGFTLATCSGFLTATSGCLVWFHTVAVPYAVLAFGFCLALIAYYLVWKYLVGFFNQVLGIA
jgi:hydrogenase/urease accessory protein HupE